MNEERTKCKGRYQLSAEGEFCTSVDKEVSSVEGGVTDKMYMSLIL